MMKTLLRDLLRAHRTLPPQMRKLGDKYVMKEFKDTRDVTKPEHLAAFRTGWEQYLAQIRSQQGVQDRTYGKELSDEAVDTMSNEQRNKLIDLRISAVKK